MSNRVNKAMVLTAGLGTRLSPITQRLPKPLVPVLNIPNILHVLFNLKKAGIEKVVMNLHHLQHEMEHFFKDKKFFNMTFIFTHENPIQGTGGGVKNAERFLKDSTFVLANCDFVTNIDIGRHIDNHFQSKSIASMLLIQDPSRAELYSKVGIDSNNRLVSLPKLQTKSPTQNGIFTGIHILNSEVLNFLEAKPCGINDVLYPKLMKQMPELVCGFIDSEAFWLDTGDLPSFLQTSLYLLQRLNAKDPFVLELLNSLNKHYEEVLPQVWLEKGTKLPPKTKIEGPSIISRDLNCGTNCHIGPFAILGENCTLEDSSSVRHSVLLNGARVLERKALSHAVQFDGYSLSSTIPV